MVEARRLGLSVYAVSLTFGDGISSYAARHYRHTVSSAHWQPRVTIAAETLGMVLAISEQRLSSADRIRFRQRRINPAATDISVIGKRAALGAGQRIGR